MSGGFPAKYGFVHIPKNAGTSLVRAIRDGALPIHISSHDYPLRQAEEEIVVLRDPAERFVSAFYYSKTYWANPVNAHFDNADALAVAAADAGQPLHGMAWHELGNSRHDYLLRNGAATEPQSVGGAPTRLTWVYEPQSTWLSGQPRHHLRHRCVAVDFPALLTKLGMEPVGDLPRLNASRNPGESLSPAARNFLESLYADDYRYLRDHAVDV